MGTMLQKLWTYGNNFYIFEHMGSFYEHIMLNLLHMGTYKAYGNIYCSYLTYGII